MDKYRECEDEHCGNEEALLNSRGGGVEMFVIVEQTGGGPASGSTQSVLASENKKEGRKGSIHF